MIWVMIGHALRAGSNLFKCTGKLGSFCKLRDFSIKTRVKLDYPFK